MMLLSRHYEEIENLCRKKFTLNAQSCDDFMTSEIQNEHVWISTPVESTATIFSSIWRTRFRTRIRCLLVFWYPSTLGVTFHRNWRECVYLKSFRKTVVYLAVQNQIQIKWLSSSVVLGQHKLIMILLDLICVVLDMGHFYQLLQGP